MRDFTEKKMKQAGEMQGPPTIEEAVSNAMKSPIEYSATLRHLPFGQWKRPDSTFPTWEKVNGLVAACAPGSKHYIQYGDVYGVVREFKDGKFIYSIAQYGVEGELQEAYRRPYALKTYRIYGGQGRLKEIRRGLTYEDVMKHVKRRYKNIMIPPERTFYAQFGVFNDAWKSGVKVIEEPLYEYEAE